MYVRPYVRTCLQARTHFNAQSASAGFAKRKQLAPKLSRRGQNTLVRHIHRSSCQVSHFPSAQVFGEGGNTPTRVTPTHLLVSLPLSLCSSLWGRGQNTHARHISKGATQPRASYQQISWSVSNFPAAQACGEGGQHSHARHISKSSCQSPAFPLPSSSR